MFDGIERSIKSIFSDIVGNVQQMVRSEIRLAKAEASEQVHAAAQSAAVLAAGGVVALLSLGLLLLALVYALAIVVPPWAAALIVAAVTGAIGAALIAAGLKKIRHVTLGLPKTVATIQETVEWVKTPAR